MTAEDPPVAKLSLKERLSGLMATYGKLAVYTYLALSLLTIAGFTLAFALGFAPTSSTGAFGVLAAGWVASKATIPLRILATLGLTPLVARLLGRRKPDVQVDGGPPPRRDR